ncbi:MAG: TolC family outer membrane protein [Methylococcales bacterium]|nr:TolC family outer membrane protein [Methylococcales bacterium]
MTRRRTAGLLILLDLSGAAYAENLLDVYQLAYQSAPQLKAAGFKVDVGSAESGQALGQMLPQISGTANWSTNKLQQPGFIQENYGGTRYFVSLTQTIMDFGKFWEWQRTREQAKQYDAEHLEAQQNLMVEVVKRYFAILDAQDQLHLLGHEKQITENHLLQINQQFAKQMAKITDVYAIEAQLDQIKADEIEAESALLTTNESLRELTDNPSMVLQGLRDNIEFRELEGNLDDWIEVAKSENPTLAAQRLAINVASDNVSVQKAKYLPVVDLQLYYYDTNTGYQSIRINETKTQVAAVNVTVPIFSGGTTTQRVNEAQSTLGIKRQENEAKIRAITKETSEAFTLSNANVRRIRASQKALESAVKSREAMQSGFRYGVNTMRDVLDAQRAEYKARRDLVKSRYNYIANRIRFLKAIGTLNEENLLEVNEFLQP